MASKEREQTLTTGFWMDDITNVRFLAPNSSAVGRVAVRTAEAVIDKVNSNFGLDPPLVLNKNDMRIAWFPDVTATTNMSALDDKGLITIVKPINEEATLRVKNRLEEFQKASDKVVDPTVIKQDSFARRWDELSKQISSLGKKVDSQEKEIGNLKTSNAELKTSNAELKTSVNLLSKKAILQEEELIQVKDSNAKLQAANTMLKASNVEQAATLAQHAKIIGGRRIVLDDARRKLANDYA